MPRQNKKKATDGLRQTTLFNTPSAHRSARQIRSTGRNLHSSPSFKETVDASSDDLTSITFSLPKKISPITVSGDDEDFPRKKIVPGKSKRVLPASSSESEPRPSLPYASTSRNSGNESSQSEVPRKSRRLRRRRSVDEQHTSENETVISPSRDSNNNSSNSKAPRKRRRLRRQKSGEERTSESESADLANEVEKERILAARMRTRVKSTFQKNLEKLKRRKLKLSDEEKQSTDEYDDEQVQIYSKRRKGSKLSNDQAEEDDSDQTYSSSDFIVEDTTTVELPPEFSMETHQDLSHQFKKIFQLFVHVAVQPANKRAQYMEELMFGEQYFSVPLQVCRRNLSGLRDSLVASSVWTPKFKNTLQRYPEFNLTRLDFAVPSCDACHLGGRLSTLLGRLGGPFYNPSGFETMQVDDTAEENDGKEFHLGRFCAKRTSVFHQFSHWEYHLFHNILREISELESSLSSTGFHRVAYAGSSEPPEDLQDADGLCDWLDKRKLIDMEWQTMKSMMESARHLELQKNDVDD